MKKRYIFFVYFVFMAVSLLILINLDYLVGHFFKIGKNDLKEVDFASYQAMNKDVVYFDLDSIQFGVDDFETATITGRCYTDTETDNTTKTVTVLFRSEDICYASERRSSMGPPPTQITGALGYNHTYTRDVALLPLKEGSYEIWLFNKENEENYGLVYTNKGIVKDKSGIYIKERTVSLPVEETEIYTDGHVCLDYVKAVNAHTLALEGWIYQEDIETEGQTVYLQLSTNKETKYILCDTIERVGVAVAFENEKYAHSGFIGYTDRNWVEDGPLIIQVIMKNEEGFCNGGYIYQWDPNINEESSITPKKTDPSRYRPAKFLQDVPFKSEDACPAMRYWLDYVKVEGDQYLIEGWIVAKDQETLGQQVYLEIQTDTVPLYVKCDPIVRTGVGNMLENRLYDYSGYMCRLGAKHLPVDGFNFKIFMENENGLYTDGLLHYFNSTTEQFY